MPLLIASLQDESEEPWLAAISALLFRRPEDRVAVLVLVAVLQHEQPFSDPARPMSWDDSAPRATPE